MRCRRTCQQRPLDGSLEDSRDAAEKARWRAQDRPSFLLVFASLAKLAVYIGQRRIFAGPAADAEIRTIGFREPGTLESLAHASLVIMDRGEIGDGRNVVHENLKGFAPPLHAAVKL